MENYQTRITPAKEDAVKALKDEFEGYNGYIFTDYRGMTVAQITELRTALRKNDAQYRVIKNRFAKIAMKIPTAENTRIRPKIGYTRPMILSIGNTVAIR